MSDPTPTPSPQTPDATLISSPLAEVQTHSSFSPQEHTSSGETKAPAPIIAVVDVGSQLGPYKLVDKLGEGGMGAVYKARHTKLGKFVAMKILPQHVMSRSDALARFEREMLAVGSLHHPNIVQAHDAGEFGGVHYLSMEYVEGQDLQQFVKAKGPMSVVNACKAIRQAAQGLAAAHKLGLVHRDIKPSNLFVAKQSGQIKILDMGLALLSQEEVPAALTSTGQCFGTPDYMAPEQWSDAHTCDARADLYSLGCTLFFLLVGHPPYHSETHRTAANKMKGHVIDPIPDLLAARSDIPDELNTIYRKLMAKDPQDRFASADQLAEALAPFTRQSKPAPSSPHAPREESQTTLDTSKRTNSDAAPTQTSASLAPAIVSRSETATLSESPADQLGATSTWAGSSDAAASRSTGSSQAEAGPQAASPRRPNRNRLFIAGGAAACVLLLGVIIITITNKDGSKTKIEVPGDAKVEITTKGDEASTNTGWHGWPADAPKPAIAPFNAEQAKQHQEAWAKYLNVPVEYTNSIGMKFQLIPPGEFTMGMTKEEAEAVAALYPNDEHWKTMSMSSAPAHEVRLTQPFYLGTYEVTQEQYKKVAGVNPSHFSATGEGKDLVKDEDPRQHPVETVTFIDAAEFCIKLSKQEQFKPVYFSLNNVITRLPGDGYRLPTEAEWESACRAGTNTTWFHGEQESTLETVAWFGGNSDGRTHAVGQLKANPFGLYDGHGNVWEWCQDWHDEQAYPQRGPGPTEDPQGPAAGSARVLRGGVWSHDSAHCRIAFRNAHGVGHRDYNNGFRASLSVDAVRQALKVTGPAIPQSMGSNTRSGSRETSDGPPSTAPSDSDRSLTTSATKTEKLPATFTNSLGIEFVKVPKGTGWLGGGGGKPGERKVEFTDDFYLGKYEVTQEEWEKVTGLNPSYFSRNGKGKDAVKDISDADLRRFPIESISWDVCQLFIERLNKQAKETGWVYRLPTADEWEYACRGGPVDRLESAFDFYFEQPTNKLLPTASNTSLTKLGRTNRVGSYSPNCLGLHDMHGNVIELCQDRVQATDPKHPHWVLRQGGCWQHGEAEARASSRHSVAPDDADLGDMSLRLARVRVGTKSAKDPDREVAEWVLSLPGEGQHVNILSERGGLRTVNRLQDLPTEVFEVHAIGIGSLGRSRITDLDLERIGKCKFLQYLGLHLADNGGITDAGIEALSHSAAAKSIKGFVFGHLEILDVSDDSVASLNRFQNLETLSINAQFTDAGLQKLNLPKLKSLWFSGPNVTINGFNGLGTRSSQITEISLFGRAFGHQDLKPLTQWPLAGLNLQDAAISDAEIKPLSELRTLRSLNLNGNSIHDAGVQQLLSLKELEHLALYATLISDESCSLLIQLPKLKDLALHGTKITDAGLASLAKIKTLEHLLIQDCPGITEPAVRKLQAALPKCKIESDFKDPDRALAEWVLSFPQPSAVGISVGERVIEVNNASSLPQEQFQVVNVGINVPSGRSVTDADFERFRHVTKLEGITVGCNGAVSPISSRALESLSESASVNSIWRLSLIHGSHSIDDGAIPHLNRLKNLRMLSLWAPKLTDEGLAQLNAPEVDFLELEGLGANGRPLTLHGLKPGKLTVLHLLNSGVTDEAAPVIAGIRGLTKLNLQVNRSFSDVGARQLLTGLPSLDSISLSFTSVSDDICAEIAKHPRLTNLNLGKTQIGDRGLEALSTSTRLKELLLEGVPITDTGLGFVAKLPALEYLDVHHCKNLTEAAVRQLQMALPKCKIYSDFPNVVAIDFAAERKVAERLIKLKKGYVALADDKVGLVELKESLPQGPFYVHTAVFPNADLTDEDLTVLVGCQGLVELSLYQNTKLTPAALRTIGTLPRLKGLNLEATQCARDGLEFIANYPALENLQLRSIEGAAGGAMRTLPPCPNLKVLSTTHNVGEDGLAHIAISCPALESLALNNRTVSSIVPLAPLRKLQHLHCVGAQLTDAGITVLAELPDFQRLWIDSPDPALWKRLLPLNERLKEIALREQFAKAVPESIAIRHVTELKQLESVSIDEWIVVDAESLQQIGMLPQLRTLVIKDTIPPGQRQTFRQYTTDDVEALRRQRPDVHFHIDGKDYPATKAP